MKTAPLALAFLCILALCYIAWAQQQELVMLAEEVGDLGFKVREIAKPEQPKPRRTRTPKPKEPT